MRCTCDVAYESVGDVENVTAPRAKVVITNPIENQSQLFECYFDGPLCVHALLSNDLFDTPNEERVVEHQDLGIEDVSVVFAQGIDRARFDGAELFLGQLLTMLDACDLEFHFLPQQRNAEKRNLLMLEDERASDDDAGRDADPVQNGGLGGALRPGSTRTERSHSNLTFFTQAVGNQCHESLQCVVLVFSVDDDGDLAAHGGGEKQDSEMLFPSVVVPSLVTVTLAWYLVAVRTNRAAALA